MDETLKLKRPPISPGGIAGAVNTGARALAAMPAAVKAAPPVAAPSPLATDVPNTLKRQGQMFAPFTAHFQGADAAAAKLVDHRLQRAGGPMPSQVGPPAPMLTRPAAKPAFGMAAATFGQPHATMAEAAKPPATVPEVLARTLLSRPAQQALGYTPDPAKPGETQFNPATSKWEPAKLTRPLVSLSPSKIASAVNTGARALSALPGTLQVAAPSASLAPAQASTKLPGAPALDTNGNPVYDDAFAARNPQLLQRYQQQNVVQSVVPPPGVAATTAGGQTPAVGQLTRGAGGFTAADRAMQLGALNDLGDSNRRSEAADQLKRAQMFAAGGDYAKANAIASLAEATAGLGSPQSRVSAATVDQSRQANQQMTTDAAKLAMEQGQADAQASIAQLDQRQQQIKLKQAEQMQALTEQLLSGTPDQQKSAAASLAALQGTKPGEPIKVKRQVDTGQKDALGAPVLADQEVLYDPRTGQWIQPPAAGAGQLPPGMTKEQVAAEAKAALAAGAPEDVVRSRLAAYGVSL